MATKKTARTASSKTTTPTQATRSTTTTNKPSAPTPFQRPADGAFWLMKSEPDVYGIADLERDGTTGWEGVRNALARNYMRDHMRVGDRVLFYHFNGHIFVHKLFVHDFKASAAIVLGRKLLTFELENFFNF